MARPGSGDRSGSGIAATQLGFQPRSDGSRRDANAEIAWPAFEDYRDSAWTQSGFRGVGGHSPFGIQPARPTEAIQQWPNQNPGVNGIASSVTGRAQAVASRLPL